METELVGKQYNYKETNPQYLGEPLPKQLASTVSQKRSCADVFFCLLFLLFQAGLIAISVVAFSTGNPSILIQPHNSLGYQCGQGPYLQKYPYLYAPVSGGKNYTCANYCPNTQLESPQCRSANQDSVSCSYLAPIYNTSTVVRTCLPVNSFGQTLQTLSIGLFSMFTSDLIGSWPLILVSVGWSMILGFFMFFLLKKCGPCLIWASIVVYFAAMVGLGIGAFVTSYKSAENQTLMQVIAYVSWSIAGLSFLVLLCIFGRIKIASHIIRAASNYTEDECQSILIPLVTLSLHIAFVCYWVVTAIFLFSAGTPISPCKVPFNCYTWNQNLRNSLIYLFVALFWDFQFILCLGQFIIASSVAYWYFRHLEGAVVNRTLLKSFKNGVVFHSGSIAFGSLILVFCFVIKLLFESIRFCLKDTVQKQGEQRGDCARICCDCCRCCLHCFQRFIRFLDKNAFIMMAISGQSFCQSAHQAFYLIMRSKELFAVTHGVAHLIMMFSKLMITAISTLCSYLLLTQTYFFSTQIYQPFFPTLMFAVISFMVASAFMDVFGVGSQTILLLYCVQMDILKQARACPPQLREIMLEYKK